jgi:hypothetical protein
MNFTGNEFIGLQFSSYGGAIFSVGGTSHRFTGNVFRNNIAPVVAAAVGLVYWESANGKEQHFEENSFVSNGPTGLGAGGVGIFYCGAEHQ